MEEQKKRFGITSFHLKLMAMALMLCDHLWATIVPGADWLTCLGRIAFPLFAFMIAEGYAHTRNPKAYRRRIFLWALLTELPFNLMAAGGLIYPFHQNVLFTFWIALVILGRLERAKRYGSILRWLLTAMWTAVGYILGFVLFVDYFGYGVCTVVVFWLARELPWSRLWQLAGMALINLYLMEGLHYQFRVLGQSVYVPQQAFAMLALLPIWLYNGRQGPYNKTIRRLCYAFYPAHMLALYLIWRLS